MNLESLLLFIPTAVVVVVMPGPDFIAVSRAALSQGRLAGCLCALGVAAGISVHTLIAIAGITAVIAHSLAWFAALKWCGAAYLCWIGVRSFLASFEKRRPGTPAALLENDTSNPSKSLLDAWVQGFLCNVLNPKAVVFFLTLLPQFMDPHSPLTPQFAVLGGILGLTCAVWFSLLSIGLGYMRGIVASPRFDCWLNRVAACFFVGFGIRLATLDTP